MCKSVGAGRVVPEEKRLTRFYGPVYKVKRTSNDFIVHILHTKFGFGVHAGMRGQRTGVYNNLFTHLAPSRINRWVVYVRGGTLYDIPRAEFFTETGGLWIFR